MTRTVSCSTTLGMAAFIGGAAHAQDRPSNYPTKPVRIIAGSAPGAAVDFTARLAAQALTATLGQTFIVEPRLGASGTIAGEYVAKSAPDGYTLGLGSMATLCVVPHLYARMGYDSLRDYAPVTIVAAGPFVVDVHPSVPARTLKELIALGKAHSGKLTFGTAGPGSVSHLGIEMLKSMGQVNFLHIPYKDVAQRMVTQGMAPVLNTPEQFAERIKVDLRRWGKAIRDAGIKPE